MLLRIFDLFFHCVSRALHEPSCSVLYAALDSLIKVHLWRMLVKKNGLYHSRAFPAIPSIAHR